VRGGPAKKGTAIMKLTTTTQISVDGVVPGNGGPDENRSGTLQVYRPAGRPRYATD
jgi:hypothetical protein